MNPLSQKPIQKKTPSEKSSLSSTITHRILALQIHDELATQLTASQKWDLQICNDTATAKQKLLSEKYDLIIFHSSLLDQHTEFLSLFKSNSDTQKICIVSSGEIRSFARWQDELGIQRFVFEPAEFFSLTEAILQILTRLRLKTGQRDLLKELDFKNRELEQLTDGLELNVQERTKSTGDSKKEAEQKQKRARNLIYFIKDLGKVESTEEIFLLLQKELRLHLGVTDLMLGLKSTDGSGLIYYLQGQNIHHIAPQLLWPLIKATHAHSHEMQRYLAEHLGRPVASVLYMPFLVSLSAHQDSFPFICIEHGYKQEVAHTLMEFLAERIQAVAIAVDRVFMANSLRESAMQWEKTFDALDEPVNIVDSQYQLLRSNNFFSEEVSSGSCYKVFQNLNKPCFGCPMAAAMKSGESQIGEIRRGDRIFRVNSYPIKIPGSESSTTVVNHYLDVTEDKKLYSRMIQSEKMAALGIMAGHIAHELNNPLTGLRSLSQVLQSEIKTDERLNQDLSEIEKAVERCQLIIKNLLEFSSLGDSFEQKSASLNTLVEHTLPMIKTALRMHRSHIELTEKEVPVIVNPHLLQQVIFNLVNNACQAMPDSGDLTVKTELAGRWMELSISDNGSGIPDAIKDRIFEPFFTTKPEGVGTGLGLSMSRSVVESFGGSLTLLKSDSTGTTFVVRLPIGTDESSCH